MDTAVPKRNRTLKRVAIAVGSTLVGLAALLTLTLVLIDSDAVVNRVINEVLPRVSEKVGREVTVEGAHVRILPNPHVELSKLTVHGEGGEPALLEAAKAELDLALWPLLRSFGKELHVDGVTVLRPEVNLLRDKDGVWNFENLGPEESTPSEREVLVEQIVVEDAVVRVIDRSGSHGEATIALTDLDVLVRDYGPGQSTSLRAAAAFAADTQNLEAQLEVSALPESFQDLAPEQYPEVTGSIRLNGAEVPRLEGFLPAKLATLTTGGRVDLDADVRTEDGSYVVAGDARLEQLRLRGQPANGGFHVATRIDPAAPRAGAIELTKIQLQGPGVDLGGNATFALSPMSARFALAGPLLDLDAVLGALPEEQEAPPQRTAMIPARVRGQLDDVDVRGTLKIDRVVKGKLEATDLEATAVLRKGVLRLDKAGANLHAGRVDASGTTVVLIEKVPSWNLKARLQSVDVGSMMGTLSGAAALNGKADASLNLRGKGAAWEEIQQNLTGSGVFAMREGALTTTDLGAKLAGVVAEGLKRAGQGGAGAAVERGSGRTELKDLTAAFTVADGWLALREPATFTSKMGSARLDGRVGLNQALDLQGTVVLSQPFLTATLGRTGLRPQGPVQVPLELEGTLKDPVVKPGDPAAIARALVSSGAQQKARQVEDTVKREARRRIGGVLERLGGGGR